MPVPPTKPQPWCLQHQTLIEDLKHEVYGNGRVGLRTAISEVDKKADLLMARADTGVRILKWAFGVMLTVSIPLVIVLLGWGWNLYMELLNLHK